MHKIRHSGGLCGRLSEPFQPFGCGSSLDFILRTTTLINSNEEINGTMKIVKSLEKSVILIKGVSETIFNAASSFTKFLNTKVLSKQTYI